MKNSFNKKIIFTNTHQNTFYPPKPAHTEIPKWYKDTSTYINNNKFVKNSNQVSGTIKKCMPIFDAITHGYILYTQVDVQVSRDEDNNPYYLWPSQDAITFHPVEQAPLHPLKNNFSYAKWNNPYSIKTPSGYSTLFLSPMHSPNKFFTIFEGIVDTDTYDLPVSFPFVLNDKDWIGIIPAGTPMAQVIPIKRNSWVFEFGSDKEIKNIQKNASKLKTLFANHYKNFFWQKKQFN
jgi:hypothetical protein